MAKETLARANGRERQIPLRTPRAESSIAGYALPVFAHSLEGLDLHPNRNYSQPATLSPRSQRKVDAAPIPHTSDVVHMEHLQAHGDTVFYDTFPADWRTWSVLAPKKLLAGKEKRLAHLTGVSVAWITTEPDGSHKLAVQKRDNRNKTNPATYGPSASGAWDAHTEVVNGKQIIKDPSPEDALRNVFRETSEELGLPEGILRDPRVKVVVAGIAEDKIKPHYDVTYFGVLPFSVQEVQKIHAAARSTDTNPDEGHGSTDGLTFIDAKPSSIRTMLTDVNSPLPPVSIATFLLAGYMLTMQEALQQTGSQEGALQQALAWKGETEKGIERNYRRMFRRSRINNAITAAEDVQAAVAKGVFRKGIGSELSQATSRFRKYNTAFPPHKQGLEDIDFALQEAGVERTASADYLLNDLLRSGQGLESFGPNAASKYAEILSFIDPAVAKLHQLANVTDVPWFSFLRNLQTSDDPTTALLYGPKETRLARLQYRIGNGFDFLKIPGTDTIVPVQAETWGSDIKFEDKSHRKLDEDATLAIPFGDGRLLTAIFDGATSRRPIEGLERYGVTGAWYVSHAASLEFPYSDEFKALSQNPDASAKDIMVALNTWMKGKLQQIDGVTYDDVLYLPGMAATLAVVDYNKQLVDIAHVADTVAIAEYDNGYEVLTDNKNASWDEETTRLIDSIVAESSRNGERISPLAASRDPRVSDHLARSYTQKINTPNGTGILNGQDELITNDLIFTKTIPLPADGGMRLHLVTDGVYSVWTNRREMEEKQIGTRRLLGALHTPQYWPGNPIYDAVTRLELDPHAEVMPRIIKEFDDGTRVSAVIKPGDEYSPFRVENRRLLWSDFAEILDLEQREK